MTAAPPRPPRVEAAADGRRGAAFADRLGQPCAAREDGHGGLWLGPTNANGTMSLSPESAAALLPLLQAFAATGRLPGPQEPTPG